ncbi:MAG: ATP-dependent helicase UvrD/PcrA [Actinomycetota bacterium]|jgi:DNA helicase-2/ATP-dependent DNA helicase PcrA|nr:ATP-dependent helicase UvrD/PcrA [Actinomycetota bacterium]
MEPQNTLDGLDDEQRAVAEALHGPVVVLAGAGTGKTRAITHRIAHGVATGDHDPRRTLAVTFTARAAGEMRSRLRDLGVDGVQVRTFHAAALRQLRYFWPRLSGGTFPELLPSKARLVAEAASRCRLPTDSATIRDLSADLEWAKVNFLTGAAIGEEARRAHRNLAADGAEVARVQSAYEEAKASRGLLDFEDVLLVTAGALAERPDIADEVRKAYRWFTVDEYQDVNPLQHRLLGLWLGDRDDLCVVGDANQTIYTFTGASPRYLTGFRAAYPDATEVRLVRCYRCTPEIVAMANGVIAAASPSAAPSTLVLRSQRPSGPVPTVEAYDDDVDEARQAAARARDYLAAGTPARDIAVLFRINAQSAALEEAFAEAGVPVVLRGTERFFDRPEVREAVTRLRGAARGGEQLGPLGNEVRAVLSSAGWSADPPRTSGAVRERWESLAALVTLADELAVELADSLPAFVVELDSRAELQHAPVGDGVTLASMHSAKGLEWPIVLVVGCSDGLMPLQYADTPEQVEEERRLAYVAITRAADRLHLSWARARQPGGRASRSASPFLVAAGAASPNDRSDASVRRGSAKSRSERTRKGPAKCRVCRKGLVSAEERTLGRCRTCPSDLNEPLLEALREWRLGESRERAVPAYVIFTDATLIAIAEQVPGDADALLEIPGLGPKKLDAYGDAVLALISEHG